MEKNEANDMLQEDTGEGKPEAYTNLYQPINFFTCCQQNKQLFLLIF